MTPEQIAKLPKFAQSHIASLESELRDLKAFGQPQYEPRWDGDTPSVFVRNIVKTNYIETAIGGIYCSIIYRHRESEVEVSVNPERGIEVIARDLAIHPRASNVVTVTGNRI